MKKKKLSISQLKVTSFVTDLDAKQQETIAGGVGTQPPPVSSGDPETGCSGSPRCTRKITLPCNCPPTVVLDATFLSADSAVGLSAEA